MASTTASLALQCEINKVSWSRSFSAEGNKTASSVVLASPLKVCKTRAIRCEAAPSAARRDVLVGGAASIAIVLAPAPLVDNALALAAPKGFAARQDTADRYQFYYPFGWQEVTVRGQDVVFKDVIEPLESVSVNIFPTEKTSLEEIGPIEQVAQTLVEKVLTAPSQEAKLLDTRLREVDGRTYYDFEFVAQASGYTRHALGSVAIANGKFYTLTTGSNERRWSRVEEKLRVVVGSFVTL